MKLGPPSPYTCPDCHGVLVQLQEGNLLRFRCHTGHAFSVGTRLAAITESVDDSLWNTLRTLDEQLLLLRHLAQHVGQQHEVLEQRFRQAAQENEARANLLRQLLLKKEAKR